MKTILLILSILVAANSFSYAQTASIKLNQTFSSREINSIDIDIHNPNLQVKPIKWSIIVVEISIEINSTNFRLLEFVADKGRYNILGKFDKENKRLSLKDPEIKDEIKFKGKTIQEKVIYTVYIPENKEVIGVDLVAGR